MLARHGHRGITTKHAVRTFVVASAVRHARGPSSAMPPSSRKPSSSSPARGDKPRKSVLRHFLESGGILHQSDAPKFDFVSLKSSMPSSHTFRRTRLPMSKAKALAQESRALREQVASSASATQGNVSLASSAAMLADASPSASDRLSKTQTSAPWTEAEPRPTLPLTSTHITSSELPEVVAFATAKSYNFDVLLSSGRLPANWIWLEDREVIYIPSWPPTPAKASTTQRGSVFIFRSGCYVTWGMSTEQNSAFYRDVIRDGSVPPVEESRYDVAGDEAMEYVHIPNEVTRVVGDLIVIGHQRDEKERHARSSRPPSTPSLTLQARLAFSQGLAASARLSVQESVLLDYLESVAPIPSRLEASGKVPLPRKEVIRKLGTLLRIRQRLNLDRDNFIDDPELYWENSHMEALYRSICSALDMKPRFEALNAKLNHCENLLEVLRALLTEQSSHHMELIIIYLIAFEVGMALVSHEYVPTPQTFWQWLWSSAAAS